MTTETIPTPQPITRRVLSSNNPDDLREIFYAELERRDRALRAVVAAADRAEVMPTILLAAVQLCREVLDADT